ncbi:hypothetical protein [Bryobacter aggregatus]|uniref:hypothetical protein n=1 Tax=Bryobacter aggregatus TaxID=360054 RepID=UPI00068CB73C|nr:hypothetical protein [Bryobacter aggregatus]
MILIQAEIETKKLRFGRFRAVFLIFLVMTLAASDAGVKKRKSHNPEGKNYSGGPPVLWIDPSDIASRNLFFGPGGEQHQPREPFTFLKEDHSGSNPKFDVLDRDGVKWKVKLGAEARPETVSTRFVWAAGYFADEEYFLETLKIQHMPQHLRRGNKLLEADGSVRHVRLKRQREGKAEGDWKWKENPFSATREGNGLRVLMALLNNWDLKDENNVRVAEDGRLVYLVSDLGASFGTTGLTLPLQNARGNLKAYTESKFIAKVHGQNVDFGTPASAPWILFLSPDFYRRFQLRSIGHNIPREDARWLGNLLGKLSPAQIGDAFRAAGYSPLEIQRFSEILLKRIEALQSL